MTGYEDKNFMRVHFPAMKSSLYHPLKHLALATFQNRIFEDMAHAFNLI